MQHMQADSAAKPAGFSAVQCNQYLIMVINRVYIPIEVYTVLCIPVS